MRAGRTVVIILFVVVASFSIVMNHIQERDNDAAKREGFIDARDKSLANSRGFSDPAAWKTNMVAEAEVARNQAEIAAKQRAADIAARTVSRPTIELTGWSKDGFGTVGIVNLKVTNTSKLSWISDVRVLCEFFGGSGTPINSRHVTVYDVIEPSKSIRKKLNFGFIDQQANRASCRFDGANVPTGMIIGY